MKRRIIKQANQAYTITLPIEWIRANGLTKSTEIDVKILNNALILSNSESRENKKTNIKIDNDDIGYISRRISALYAKGIDEIEISSSKDIQKVLYGILDQYIGFALLSQKSKDYIIKDIGGIKDNVEEIFKRVFQVLINFYESAYLDIFGKQEETIENLASRDREINRLCLYLQRAINKSLYSDDLKGRILFTYSFELEKIGDEIHRLWRTNIKHDVKKSPELKKLMEESKDALGFLFDSFSQNKEYYEDIKSLRQKVREDSLSMLRLNPYTARFVRHITKIIEDSTDLIHLNLMIQEEK